MKNDSGTESFLQCCCNLAAGNETNQGQLWNSLFPETLLTLFRLLKSHEDLTSLLVAWIHMLTAQSEDRRYRKCRVRTHQGMMTHGGEHFMIELMLFVFMTQHL